MYLGTWEKIILLGFFLGLLTILPTSILNGQEGPSELKKLRFSALQAGYITRTKPPSYIIYDSQEHTEILGQGDIIFFDGGKEDGIKSGDQLLVFKLTQIVTHPITQVKLGYLINIAGRIRVIRVQDKTSVAIITHMYDDYIHKGDQVMPFMPEDVAPKEKVTEKSPRNRLRGYIVAIKDERQIAGSGDIVYLDLGKSDRIEIGEILNIYHLDPSILKGGKETKEYLTPENLVGRLKILNTQDNTSTAIITRSRAEISVGDKVAE